MSVDLGEFNVLEKRLPEGHEVVLIDLRESVIDTDRCPAADFCSPSTTKELARTNRPPSATASWVGPELLASHRPTARRRKVRSPPAAASSSPTTATRPSPATSSTGRDRARRRPPRRRTRPRHRLAGAGPRTRRPAMTSAAYVARTTVTVANRCASTTSRRHDGQDLEIRQLNECTSSCRRAVVVNNFFTDEESATPTDTAPGSPA